MSADANDERALREQLDELKYKYRLMESLYLMISHDVRAPLTAIRGFTEVLLRGVAGELSEQQIRCLTAAKNKAENLG
jgi:signal transduction histidine kinase